jgi:hypothetical protein
VHQLQLSSQPRAQYRSKNTQNSKAIQQIECSIIQKLAELILKIVLPAELTVKNATEFTRIIIQQLLGCESPTLQDEQLDKGKKGVKRVRKAKTVNS